MANETKSPFIWYELMTQDLDKAVQFYGNVVGWEVNDSGIPGMPYMIFSKGGKAVGGMMSWSSMGMSKPTAWKGHVLARDVEAEAAAVAADGGKLQRPVQAIPEVGRFAVVADPQGAEYLLFEPKEQQVPAALGPMELGSVGWHELMTTDWESAWEFYSKHYGWTKHMAVDMGPAGTYQTFMANDTQGGGMMNITSQMTEKVPGPAWLFYFTVDDINAAAQRIKDSGGTVTMEPREVPGGSWVLQGVDTQSGHFALSAPK